MAEVFIEAHGADYTLSAAGKACLCRDDLPVAATKYGCLQTLGALVPEPALLDLGYTQQIIFHAMDVIITGGVIAGGSDGIHKMAEWYRTAMESRSNAFNGIARR